MDNNKENTTTAKKRRMRRDKIDEIVEIKAKIEADAEKKVVQLNNNINSFHDYGKPDIGKLLISIMQNGANEFKEKTGRNMTYSEMREMFG
jgi:hypothetical protein